MLNALIDYWKHPEELLFHIIESDDLVLETSEDVIWFKVVKNIFQNHKDNQTTAAKYYQALFEFNRKAAIDGQKRKEIQKHNNGESKEDGIFRLLLARPAAGNNDAPKLFQTPTPPAKTPSVNADTILPGTVPFRLAGRKPKDFFSLVAAFCGTQSMGMDATPENVYENLTGNPSFARACNFTPPSAYSERQTDIPKLRKIEQFDQIMTANGLWSELKKTAIDENFNQNIIYPEKDLVHDTTHHFAFSGFETVEYTDEKGKERKKSQSHVTKKCSCQHKEDCQHAWELSGDGAGTVVKKHNVYHWAHKASIIGLPEQAIPIINQAMTDGASHDSNSIIESLDILKKHFPEVAKTAKNLLDDSAADDPKLKRLVEKKFGIKLRCHINPRRRKTLKEKELPKGMASLTPNGTLRCKDDLEMDYQGKRQGIGYYYGPPRDEQNRVSCESCPFQSQCCHKTNTCGRHVIIPFAKLPNISQDDPPMAKRFQKLMKKRPSVERMIYRLKCTLGDRYLSKRGNLNYQASLDKAMLALHLIIQL